MARAKRSPKSKTKWNEVIYFKGCSITSDFNDHDFFLEIFTFQQIEPNLTRKIWKLDLRMCKKARHSVNKFNRKKKHIYLDMIKVNSEYEV
jgi:hypothetical protein